MQNQIVAKTKSMTSESAVVSAACWVRSNELFELFEGRGDLVSLHLPLTISMENFRAPSCMGRISSPLSESRRSNGHMFWL